MRSALLPVAVAASMLVPMYVAGHLVLLTGWLRDRRRPRRSPLTTGLLRGPGQSLRAQLEALDRDFAAYLVLAAVAPLFMYAVAVTQRALDNGLTATGKVIYLAGALGVLVFCVARLIPLLLSRRKLRLGLEGELAVAQELDRLMRLGCDVFHDVPAGRFNIDHVVVSGFGVFVIETKCRAKPVRHRGSEDATVIYDGKRLRFPEFVEHDSLRQATISADWVARWLREAIGESVPTTPVIALPGWLVSRRGPGYVCVVNPLEFKRLLRGPRPIDEAQQRRIAHQLDRVCRLVTSCV